MNKITKINKLFFLLPVYNDWETLSIVLSKINLLNKKLKKKTTIIIVNDCSDNKPFKYPKFKYLNHIKVVNLKKNLGSQKAISIGLQYLYRLNESSIVTILDSDGEDDVKKIPLMINQALNNPNKVIVSSRIKRNENFIFKFFYFFFKVLTLLFTLKWISYGNYSSFNSQNLRKILINESSWLAISASFAKNCKIYKVGAERKKRIGGISKISIIGLINHGLRINAVFLNKTLFISTLYISIFYIIINSISLIIFKTIVGSIILFNFLLLITYIKNDNKKYLENKNFIKSIHKIK